MNVGEIGSVCEDQTEKRFSQSLGDCYFVDDVSGKLLDGNLVKAAREDERIGVNKHNVYTKVPIQECFSNTGGPPVSTKWVDVNKGMKMTPITVAGGSAESLKAGTRTETIYSRPHRLWKPNGAL